MGHQNWGSGVGKDETDASETLNSKKVLDVFVFIIFGIHLTGREH